MSAIRLFINSVQKEFSVERMALRDYLRGDALMRRFFHLFLYEVPLYLRLLNPLKSDENMVWYEVRKGGYWEVLK